MRPSLPLALVLCGLLSPACSSSDDAACDPTQEACTFSKALSVVDVPAGFEDEDMCQSWTLNNPTELWVTSIEQSNDGGYHHANWFFVPDDNFDLPDGTWVCSEQNFTELGAAILGGYLFAMSTQSQLEKQSLPGGGAIRIPPYSRIIGASHILNASDQPVTTEMRLSIGTVPPDQVLAKLVPSRIQYHDLHIDPNSRSSFTTECAIADTYQKTMGAPMKYQLYYALVHYHALGAYAELQLAGGPRDGEVLFHYDGYGENFGIGFDPPIDLVAAGATGLRYTCGFDNPRADEVQWGIGDQEMCVLALQASTDMGWEGDVNNGTGEQIGVAPDGQVEYQGPCGMLGIPWDHDKPGGPPR